MPKNPTLYQTEPAMRCAGDSCACPNAICIWQENYYAGFAGTYFRKYSANVRDPVRTKEPGNTGRPYCSASEHAGRISRNPRNTRSPVLLRNHRFTGMSGRGIRPTGESPPALPVSYLRPVPDSLTTCRKEKTNE